MEELPPSLVTIWAETEGLRSGVKHNLHSREQRRVMWLSRVLIIMPDQSRISVHLYSAMIKIQLQMHLDDIIHPRDGNGKNFRISMNISKYFYQTKKWSQKSLFMFKKIWANLSDWGNNNNNNNINMGNKTCFRAFVLYETLTAGGARTLRIWGVPASYINKFTCLIYTD